MKIVIPGGTGQVGKVLTRAFHRDGHEVIALSRAPKPADVPGPVPGPVPSPVTPPVPTQVLAWDAVTLGPWVEALEGADVVINLAGRSVDCRYTAANKRAILDSRVLSTRVVGQAIAAASRPPRVWLQACTATIYAHSYDTPQDEILGTLGGNEPDVPDSWHFSIDVAKAWEREVDEAHTPATRKVKLRSAMTMSPDAGGIFDTLLTLVRRGLGGTAGDGRQYVSWIHERDFVRAVLWLIDHESLEGVVNLAAPSPLPNVEFMRALRAAWGTRIGLPASRGMLALGALFLRTETELILKSRRVVPRLLLESGFRFDFPQWPAAARDLCMQRRARS